MSVELPFRVLPQDLKNRTHVKDAVLVKFTYTDALLAQKMLGNSGKLMADNGFTFEITKDIADQLIAEGIAIEENSQADLRTRIKSLFTDPNRDFSVLFTRICESIDSSRQSVQSYQYIGKIPTVLHAAKKVEIDDSYGGYTVKFDNKMLPRSSQYKLYDDKVQKELVELVQTMETQGNHLTSIGDHRSDIEITYATTT